MGKCSSGINSKATVHTLRHSFVSRQRVEKVKSPLDWFDETDVTGQNPCIGTFVVTDGHRHVVGRQARFPINIVSQMLETAHAVGGQNGRKTI
jgi:hypothetical protein